MPLFGYSSVEEYYRAARNSDKLHKICIPYISITATDDPFVPIECRSAAVKILLMILGEGPSGVF